MRDFNKMENKKKSILKEAVTEYNEILDAANANAKKKLAEEFPDKFKSILKEELNKNKSEKESYKKIDNKKESNTDNSEENKESTMKKTVKEAGKAGNHEKKAPFEEKPKAKTANMNEENETVEVEDEMNEEREKEFVKKKHEKDEPNFAKGTDEVKGKKFTKKVNASSGKPITNKVHESHDITDMNYSDVEETIDTAGEDDEFLTMEDIEMELTNMENDAELDNDDPLNELLKMKNQLDEMIGKLGGVKEQRNAGGKQNFSARNAMGNDGGHIGMNTSQIDEEDEIYRAERGPKGKFQDAEELTAEQKRMGGKQSIPGRENGGPTTSMIDEDDDITDADIEAILNQNFDNEDSDIAFELDETLPHTITHANARQTGAQNHTNYGKENRLRHAMRESNDKKVNGLINENKKLIKKLNENKKYSESLNKLVENYKNALEKYRNQLKEMAVFNTNLAHVNNLFVNENLALTQEDKIKIIKEFKGVNSITESQNKYKSFLSEMKVNKKRITETIENKVGVSIQPSSKNRLDEVVEKTAYENNEHLNKMKRIIEAIEKKDNKKKII